MKTKPTTLEIASVRAPCTIRFLLRFNNTQQQPQLINVYRIEYITGDWIFVLMHCKNPAQN